jgi:hypothetical protein
MKKSKLTKLKARPSVTKVTHDKDLSYAKLDHKKYGQSKYHRFTYDYILNQFTDCLAKQLDSLESNGWVFHEDGDGDFHSITVYCNLFQKKQKLNADWTNHIVVCYDLSFNDKTVVISNSVRGNYGIDKNFNLDRCLELNDRFFKQIVNKLSDLVFDQRHSGVFPKEIKAYSKEYHRNK